MVGDELMLGLGGKTALPPLDRELLGASERAFTASRLLDFAQSGRQTQRRIEPHGLLVRTPFGYRTCTDARPAS